MQTAPLSCPSVDPRRDLAAFLRSRRGRVRPGQVGMPDAGPRRTSGLRREEVAVLAGVGVTWYTWLEQGRPINPSDEVLASIARVLLLSEAETRYLFTLARGEAPPAPADPAPVPDTLLATLDGLEPAPALVIDRRWDVLAWNRTADALFGFDEMPAGERNTAWIMLARRSFRRLLLDWAKHARLTVGQLRVACTGLRGDDRFADLLRRLRAAEPQVETWWREHDVAEKVGGQTKTFRHPRVGDITIQDLVLQPAGAPDLELLVKQAVDTPSADRLRLLTERFGQRGQSQVAAGDQGDRAAASVDPAGQQRCH